LRSEPPESVSGPTGRFGIRRFMRFGSPLVQARVVNVWRIRTAREMMNRSVKWPKTPAMRPGLL